MNHYNNLGIGAISLCAVLRHSRELSISQLCLIVPFISHKATLDFLSRKNTSVKSIEHLIIKKTIFFVNFNRRYYDSLCLTFNALQFLNDLGYVRIQDNTVIGIQILNYDKKMGKRAKKVFKASKKIATLLKNDINKLYLNLRIEL